MNPGGRDVPLVPMGHSAAGGWVPGLSPRPTATPPRLRAPPTRPHQPLPRQVAHLPVRATGLVEMDWSLGI